MGGENSAIHSCETQIAISIIIAFLHLFSLFQFFSQVYHDCDDGKTPCQRHFVLQLPKSYVSSEGTKSAPFNLGVINLEISYPKEDRNCLGTLSGK